jgi:aspartyl-tRNA(Asn)/glutamyl-tRNA(Gln) amidotransferase subunit A
MAQIEPLHSTVGCLSRSVRDTARWLDVANGAHPRDPFSLPRVEGFEAGLGSHELAGLRVAVLHDFGGAVVHPDVAAGIEEAASALIAAAGMRRVDVDFTVPDMAAVWSGASLPTMWHGMHAYWPQIRELLTDEVAALMARSETFTIADAAAVDPLRKQLNESFADLFESVDLVLAPTNPDDAYPAEGPSPVRVGDVDVANAGNTGRMTMGMNITGVPAISVPAGLSPRGMPIGMQIVGPRHSDALLLSVAALFERERPWPLVAPSARAR